MTHSKSMIVLAEEYLALRRKLGFALRVEGEELLRFARYADQSGHRGPLTVDLAVHWAKLPKDARRMYWARRLDVIRRFAKYRALFEPDTEIPPEGLFGPSYGRPPPHIYTDNEMASLLEEATNLDLTGTRGPRTYVTLFGLLACTGLRISEALRLTRSDVDLEEGVLSIQMTKFRKSRFVPVHISTVERLRSYAEDRERYHPVVRCSTFFVSKRGTPLKYRPVLNRFIALRNKLGWTGKGTQSPPRIQDLRHTFACRRLLRWYEEGVDVSRKINSLSTYLGHVRISNTYWYLTAVPELLAAAAARFERLAYEEPGGETC